MNPSSLPNEAPNLLTALYAFADEDEDCISAICQTLSSNSRNSRNAIKHSIEAKESSSLSLSIEPVARLQRVESGQMPSNRKSASEPRGKERELLSGLPNAICPRLANSAKGTKQSRKLPFSSSESDVRKRILGQGSQLSVVFAIEIEHHEQFVKPVTGGANALVFVL
ncbi:hypothetical protein QYF36_014993 [Acer negundo]|nr:hypothetical protein QYF36_002635 [Acer negundo]KAK4838599.1 hypothetical protein QYF36_014993 [Acer negundo]